jgi:aminopeptidase-like protein
MDESKDKKLNYRLRLTDYIPNNIGLLNYMTRNQEYIDNPNIGQKLAIRSVGIFYFNLALFLGISGLQHGKV